MKMKKKKKEIPGVKDFIGSVVTGNDKRLQKVVSFSPKTNA